MEGVLNTTPVSSAVPPVALAYQVTTPNEAVAPKVTTPAPQLEPGVVAVICGLITVTFFTEEVEGLPPK